MPSSEEVPVGSSLVCHLSTPCPFVQAIKVQVRVLRDGGAALTYVLSGDLGRLRTPPPGQPVRSDGLWRHTCFELFLGAAGSPAYREFNFAPSGGWAAYAFTGYRQGMAALPLAAPEISVRSLAGCLELDVVLPPDALPPGPGRRLGLSAVLEADNGTLSYWALAHPPGRPDFHHTDAFALELP